MTSKTITIDHLKKDRQNIILKWRSSRYHWSLQEKKKPQIDFIREDQKYMDNMSKIQALLTTYNIFDSIKTPLKKFHGPVQQRCKTLNNSSQYNTEKLKRVNHLQEIQTWVIEQYPQISPKLLSKRKNSNYPIIRKTSPIGKESFFTQRRLLTSEIQPDVNLKDLRVKSFHQYQIPLREKEHPKKYFLVRDALKFPCVHDLIKDGETLKKKQTIYSSIRQNHQNTQNEISVQEDEV